MSNYGKIAWMSADQAQQGLSPGEAWRRSARKVFPNQEPSRIKSCPRDAFLGLAAEGVIVGIPPGDYTNSQCGRRYAIAGIDLLREEPDLSNNPIELWRRIECDKPDTYNQQMDVVAALWKSGYITHAD